MAYDSSNTKKVDVFNERSSSIDKIEDITTAREHADQIANLSGIEATAASKAAWLISMTVSLGGLLFGMYFYRFVRFVHTY
jgi:SP family myo-inositol transporter-like MFS transporter 13